MDSRLREHYFQLWQLVYSLEEGWWEPTERSPIENLLRDASTRDPNLSHLNPADPNFFRQLQEDLEALLLAKPEIPPGNLPPKSILKDARKKRLKTLEQKREKMPLVFYDKDGNPLFIPRELYQDSQGKITNDETIDIRHYEFFSILKKHGLVDKEGKVNSPNFANASLVTAAQEEITLRLAFLRQREIIELEMTHNLWFGRVPVGLFQDEFFGKDDVPGLVHHLAGQVAGEMVEMLGSELRRGLGGQPISISSANFASSFSRAAGGVATSKRLGYFARPDEIEKTVRKYLEKSPRFQRLTVVDQNELVRQATSAIARAAAGPENPLEIIDDVLLRQAGEDVEIQLTPVSATAGVGQAAKYYSFPTQPRTIAQRALHEMNIPATKEATANIQKFIEDFAADPIGAVLHYPYYTIVHLLPGPLKNFYFGQAGWQKLFQKWFLQPARDPGAVRKLFQALLWRGFKFACRPLGLVNRKGQWIWSTAGGWFVDKTISFIGEGLGNLFSFIPIIGKPIGNIIKRYLGKKRKREETFLASVIGLFLNLAFATVLVVPKLAWALVSKLPIVKAASKFLTQKWFLFEKNFRFLMNARVLSNILRAITGSLGRGFVGYLLSYLVFQNTPISVMFGLAEIYQGTLRKLAFGKEFANFRLWARTWSRLTSIFDPRGFVFTRFLYNLFGRPALWLLKNQLAYFPLRGLLFGLLMYKLGAPWWSIPLWTGLDYVLTNWRSLFSVISPLFTKVLAFLRPLPVIGQLINIIAKVLTALGILGRALVFLGKVLFGVLTVASLIISFIPLILDLASGTPLGEALKNWMLSGWGIGGLVSLFFMLGGLNLVIPAVRFLLGFIWNRIFLPIVRLIITRTFPFILALLRQVFMIATRTILPFLFRGIVFLVTRIVSFIITLAGGLAPFLAAIAPFLVAIAIILIIIAAIIALMTIVGAIFEPLTRDPFASPSVSECFAPSKGVQILDASRNPRGPKEKAQPGDYLVYNISFGARKSEIKQVSLVDDILEKSSFAGTSPGTPPRIVNFIEASSFKVLSSPSETTMSGPALREEDGGGGRTNDWLRYTWKFSDPPSVTPSTQDIKYEIRVSSKYTEGAITNRISLDGVWVDPATSKKASCKTALYLSINSGGESAANLADLIIQKLTACGITHVNRSNFNNPALSIDVTRCLTDPVIPSVVISEIGRSVNNSYIGNGNLQCVGFVNAVEAGTGGTIQNIGLYSASDYWRTLPGYQQIFNSQGQNDVQAGDIPIWTYEPDGHMAIIISPVFDSSGQLAKIIIGEAREDDGLVRKREITTDNPSLAGWQRREW